MVELAAPLETMADNDQNIEIWKVKKLIKGLEAARGNGTSMISLILPPKDQVRCERRSKIASPNSTSVGVTVHRSSYFYREIC